MSVRINRRRSTKHVSLIALLLVVLGGSAIASAATFRLGQHQPTNLSTRIALSKFSAHTAGTPVSLTAADEKMLARFKAAGADLTAVTRLGVRGARVIYEVANTAGSNCYAAGNAQPTGETLGQVECVPGFPSAENPIVDFTVVDGGIPSAPAVHVYRAEGVAADEVAAVGFQTSDGRLVGVTPVVHNLYESTAPPVDVVTKLVALDANNSIIWSEDVG